MWGGRGDETDISGGRLSESAEEQGTVVRCWHIKSELGNNLLKVLSPKIVLSLKVAK